MKIELAINPGSGPVKEGDRSLSKNNMNYFIKDLKSMGHNNVSFRFRIIEDNGRHLYRIKKGNLFEDISMPAIPLNKVRYMGYPDQSA